MQLRIGIPALVLGACQPAQDAAPAVESAQGAGADRVVQDSGPTPDPMAAWDVERANEFADAFGLPRLTDGASDELRVWGMEFVSGNVLGTVVTPESIARYFRQDMEPGREPRSASLKTAARSPVLARLGELAVWDGKHWSCRVTDGAAVFVDGVVGGARFTFAQFNAGYCDPNAAAQLNTILGLIGEAPAWP